MQNSQEKIFVTKPYLPPLKDYMYLLKKIWQTKRLTNHGPLVKELEEKLQKYLGVKHAFFVSNGTIALQLAIRSLGIRKKIITTPFSFAATTTSILWENCQPAFADIDPKTLCIDPEKIEKALDKDVEAVMPVHVYGYPCDVKAIKRLAKTHNLKVIYDAAHAFGTKVGEKSVSESGDISVLSFHATKSFNTAEGGALVTNNDALARKIARYRDFGYEDDELQSIGINAKNSEFHAALGLCNLPQIKRLIEKRKKTVEAYDAFLQNQNIYRPPIDSGVTYNYAHYPLLFESEAQLLKTQKSLNKNKIYPRRYFYPSLNKLPYLKSKNCPISETVSRRVLCLPLYSGLTQIQIKKVTDVVISSLTDLKVKTKRKYPTKNSVALPCIGS